jgi:hypothetical protein
MELLRLKNGLYLGALIMEKKKQQIIQLLTPLNCNFEIIDFIEEICKDNERLKQEITLIKNLYKKYSEGR